MQYTKLNNKIIIEDLSEFNIEQILDCGQIFRYNINDSFAEVVSTNHYARIYTLNDKIEIESEDMDYFEHFFDLSTDYNQIKQQLAGDNFLAPCIKFGYGIRILNQDLFEMIVSFIISANNNIKRIKNSLNYLSKHFGTPISIKSNINYDSPLGETGEGEFRYYAFPTLTQLKQATIEDYTLAGLGYRAPYMYETIQNLTYTQLNNIKDSDSVTRLNSLLQFKGIGEKVAHCIMLFALHDTNLFPVDTWINKVYNDLTSTTSNNRRQISLELTNRYKQLSGYAQQYFYYYYRSNK